MRFLLSDQELVNAMQAMTRHVDGRVVLDLPASRLLEAAIAAPPPLRFDAPAGAVRSGSRSVRLSPVQFALLKYIYEHGCTGFEALQDAIWKTPTSDGAIRAACSKLNQKLCDSGFSIELSANRSRVSIEEIG